jgi:hypothetical protein
MNEASKKWYIEQLTFRTAQPQYCQVQQEDRADLAYGAVKHRIANL